MRILDLVVSLCPGEPMGRSHLVAPIAGDTAARSGAGGWLSFEPAVR
jgi:hypothetical protein